MPEGDGWIRAIKVAEAGLKTRNYVRGSRIFAGRANLEIRPYDDSCLRRYAMRFTRVSSFLASFMK